MLVALGIPGVDAAELAQIHRRHVDRGHAASTRGSRRTADEDDIGLLLVADAEIFRLEAVVRWLDAADARIARLPAPAELLASGDGPDGRRAARRKVGAPRDEPRCSRCAGSRSRTARGRRTVDALREVDLSVEAGELVAIMGPSGSGKSTLLTIAGTLEEATSGEVTSTASDVRRCRANDRARLRRRSIGYVFQDFNLLAGLTAAENVSLPLELDGIRSKAARDRRAARRSTSSASPTAPTAIPTSCRAASASGWPSPAPSSATAGCCWPTSRPARSTRSTARA